MSETLQSGLEASGTAEPAADAVSITDPAALFRHLDASGRFHRDTGIGRLFHPGQVSLRENVPNDSLHVVVEGNRVSAHVDRVSPLVVQPAGPSRYSVRRAAAHNVVGMAQDVVALLRGRQGDPRCELDCEWVPNGGETSSEADVPEPEASAWSVQLEARVAGRFDEARLREALATAFGRGTFEDDRLTVVACDDVDGLEAARGRLQALAVPVAAWPPLHAWVARGPDGDVLMLNLNHAAADGFGALQVMGAIADAYAGNMTPEASLEVLAGSDLPIRPAVASPSILMRAASGAIERLRDALARPSLLAVDQPEDRAGCRFHLFALSEDETREVHDARPSGTGSSNVFMAALHLAMHEWNLQHRTPGRRFHALTTVNLRPGDWQAAPVGNFSVTARVSTTRRDRQEPAAALRAVAAQTARNKASRTGVALMAALERSGLLPMWAKQSTAVLQALTGNVLVDNAMLTNLGRPDEPPSFGPDAGPTVELWVSTPARSPLTLSLGAVTIGGRLHLSFRYPNRLFGPEAARRFAEGYLRQLLLVAHSRS